MKKLIFTFAILLIYQSIFADNKAELAWQVNGKNVYYTGMHVSESGKYAFTMCRSADDKTCGEFNYEVQMWNIETGELKNTFPLPQEYFKYGDIPGFSCSADGTKLLVYREMYPTYWLFDIESGAQLKMKRISGYSEAERMKFAELTDDGTMFLTRISKRNNLEMIIAETGETAFTVALPEGADEYGCMSKNSLYFATYFADNTIKIINTVTGAIEKEIKMDTVCIVIAISSDLKYLTYTIGINSISIFNIEEEKVCYNTLDGKLGFPFLLYCEFSRDNKKCLFSSYVDSDYGLFAPQVYWLDKSTGVNYESKSLNKAVLPKTAAMIDNKELIYINTKKELIKMDYSNWLETTERKGFNISNQFAETDILGAVTGIEYNKNNNKIYTSSTDGRIKEWDLNYGNSTDSYIDFERPLSAMDISANSDTIIAVYPGGVLYSPTSDFTLQSISSTDGFDIPIDIECSTLSEYNTLHIMIDYYNSSIGVSLPNNISYYDDDLKIHPFTCTTWSNDGTKVAVGTVRDRVALFDVLNDNDGKPYLSLIKVLDCVSGNPQYFTIGVKDIKFSPDDTELLVITETSEVPLLISVEDGSRSVIFEDCAWHNIFKAEFLGNSDIIAIGGSIDNVIFMNWKTGKLIEKFQDLALKYESFSLTSNDFLVTTEMEFIESEELLVFGTNYDHLVALDVSKLLETNSVSSEKSNLYIYPNPAEDYLNINAPTFSKIKIYDITGSLIIETNDHRIDVSNYTSGMYVVVIENNGQVSRQKFLIK